MQLRCVPRALPAPLLAALHALQAQVASATALVAGPVPPLLELAAPGLQAIPLDVGDGAGDLLELEGVQRLQPLPCRLSRLHHTSPDWTSYVHTSAEGSPTTHKNTRLRGRCAVGPMRRTVWAWYCSPKKREGPTPLGPLPRLLSGRAPASLPLTTYTRARLLVSPRSSPPGSISA